MGCLTRTLGRLLFVTIIISSAYLHLSKPQNYTEDLSSNYAQFTQLVNQHLPGYLPPAEAVFCFVTLRLTGPSGVKSWDCSKVWLPSWSSSVIAGVGSTCSSTYSFLDSSTIKTISTPSFNGTLADNLRYFFVIKTVRKVCAFRRGLNCHDVMLLLIKTKMFGSMLQERRISQKVMSISSLSIET